MATFTASYKIHMYVTACIHTRDVTIHNLGVLIYCPCVSRYSDILYDTIKCELTDF